ncbi:MAG: SPOR domain-containing protein [Bacteroidales bacterium]|nr:SPOR domain-containing protein [Bacteroidales bacterium]MCF8403680.1 SPOR domain-containing protein [Bacteroidales bacterium]
MKLKLLFAAVLISGVYFGSIAQDSLKGKVKVFQDSRIDSLLVKYVEVNQINPAIEGWRIEIFFEAGNTSKKQAMEARAEFINKFSETPSYLLFQQPYYKVRVGDFRTKMEAEKFKKEIESDYPNAFVVSDEINFPRLD